MTSPFPHDYAGPWFLQTDLTQVVAQNRKDGRTAHTSVILFPVGYRIGKVWSAPVPKRVEAAARRLVRRAGRT